MNAFRAAPFLLVAASLGCAKPFAGTITYTAEQRGLEPSLRTFVVGPTTMTREDANNRFFFDETGRRWRSRDNESGGPVMTPVVATPLPDRKIAGRSARCLQTPPRDTLLLPIDEELDHEEYCLFVDERVVRFSDTGFTTLDVDKAFADLGLRGLPAQVVVVDKKGVYSVATATKLTPGSPAPTKETFFAATPESGAPLVMPAPAAGDTPAREQCEKGHKAAVRDEARSIVISQMVHMNEHDAYARDVASLGWVSRSGSTVAITASDDAHYVAVVSGTGAHAGEVWQIDETNMAKQISAAPCP